MSNAVSALGNASYDGYAQVREMGPLGMISLRAKPDVKGLDKAIKAAVGTKVPGQRQIERAGDLLAGWMSPDEYLLVMPYADTAAAMLAIDKSLKGQHYLAVVVSDARAVFKVTGEKADQVLAKLSPVDFGSFGAQELRRTRAAQVATAIWRDNDGYTVVCFRSVATYMMGLLRHSAIPGSEL